MRILLAALVLVTGCAGFKNPFSDTRDFHALVCADGIVPVACQDVGTIAIPTNGDALLRVAVLLGGPLLAREAKLSDCVFTSYPPTVEADAITVTASAACTLKGMVVDERLTITLAPVAPPG
jgi:hypothetical protein